MDFNTRHFMALMIAVMVGFSGFFFFRQNLSRVGENMNKTENVNVVKDYESGISNDPKLRPKIHNIDDNQLNKKVMLIHPEDVKNMDIREIYEFRDYNNLKISKENITVRGELKTEKDENDRYETSVLEYRVCDNEDNCNKFRVKVQLSDQAKKRGS